MLPRKLKENEAVLPEFGLVALRFDRKNADTRLGGGGKDENHGSAMYHV